MPPHLEGFLRRFCLKTGLNFAHFGLESGMVLEGTTVLYERIYRFNSKVCDFEMDFKNFCLRSNLSNDNISSAERPGLKTGSGFQWCGLKTGVENDIFWSEIGSGFGEPGGTPPIKISQEYPRAQI